MTTTDKQEKIISEIRRVAEAVKPEILTQRLYKRHGQIPLTTVRNNLGSWGKAVLAAGLTPNPSGIPVNAHKAIEEDDLLNAIGELWRGNGGRPTETLMNANGRFSVRPYRARWGTFAKAVDEYVLRFGEPCIETNGSANSPKPPTALPSRAIRPAVLPETHKPTSVVSKKALFFGEPLEFRGLRYAPINEQGVVYLFGMISRELGFLIESIRTDFPDCEGKRAIDRDGMKWQHVRIEFEFRSRNFGEHGHNPDGCDLVVCWIHDWLECPVEVLELRSNIKRLPNK